MTSDLKCSTTRNQFPSHEAEYRTQCDRSGGAVVLGRSQVLSAHRTSGGVVTYLRCRCEALVIVIGDGPGTHVHAR